MADGAWAVHVYIVWTAGVGDDGYDLRAHAHTAADLVPCDLVGGNPEERSQCPRVAAGSRPWKLRDGMDMAAQDSAGHGSSRTGEEKGTDLFLSLSVDKRDNSRRRMELNPSIVATGAIDRQFQI